MPKGYMVSAHRSEANPVKRLAYLELAKPAIEAANGKFLSTGARVVAKENELAQRTVLIEFESFEAAVAANESEGYQEALEALTDGADRDIRLIRGILIMKFIRWSIGKLILCLDFITRPKPLVRAEYDQNKIDLVTSNLSLYQFNACPFCVKVRRKMRRLSLNIELRDAKNNFKFKEDLIKKGGKHKVPCLRIDYDNEEIKWIYGSDDINHYLETNFQSI